MAARRSLVFMSAGVLALTVLAGCGNSADEPAKDEPSPAAAFPAKVSHLHGVTTIEGAPTRVVTLASTDADSALLLGVVPVGAAKETVGGTAAGSTPWFDAELKEVGGTAPTRLDVSKGVDVDAVKRLDPDLILSTGRVLSDAEYQGLSDVAPVVAGSKDGQTWQRSLAAAGAAMGMSDKADQVIEATDKVIDEGAADQVGLEGTSMIFGQMKPGDFTSIGVFTPRDPKVALLNDFGLVNPEAVTRLATGDQTLVTVPGAEAKNLKSEIMLLFPSSPQDVTGLESNPNLSKIPAIDSGRAYAELNKTLHLAANQPSALSIPRVIEKLLPDVSLIADF